MTARRLPARAAATRARSATATWCRWARRSGRAGTRDMLEFPVQFFVRFFRNHGLLSVTDRPQWRVIEGGSRAYVAPLTRRFAERIRTRLTRSSASRAHADGVTVISARRQRALRRGGVRLPQRPGAARCWPTPTTAEDARCSARSRYQRQRRGAAHRHARCCRAAARPGRAGTTACARADRTAGGAHLQHEHPAGLDRAAHLLRHAEPDGRDRPAKHPRAAIRYAHPVLHARRRRRAAALGRDQRRAAARTSAARTGATASTRTAWSARCAWPRRSERAVVTPLPARSTPASVAPPALARRRAHAFRYRHVHAAARPRRSCRALFARSPLWSAAAACAGRGSGAPTSSAIRRGRCATACASCVAARTGRRPAGPVRCSTQPALLRRR